MHLNDSYNDENLLWFFDELTITSLSDTGISVKHNENDAWMKAQNNYYKMQKCVAKHLDRKESQSY